MPNEPCSASGRGYINLSNLFFHFDDNLKYDPWELNNLVDDPNHSKTLQEMRKTLNRWIRDTGDLGQNVEPMKMYDSDMKVYLNGLANRGRGDRLEEIKSNIAQMKKWWKEGK